MFFIGNLETNWDGGGETSLRLYLPQVKVLKNIEVNFFIVIFNLQLEKPLHTSLHPSQCWEDNLCETSKGAEHSSWLFFY
jgi:hypothetical protein